MVLLFLILLLPAGCWYALTHCPPCIRNNGNQWAPYFFNHIPTTAKDCQLSLPALHPCAKRRLLKKSVVANYWQHFSFFLCPAIALPVCFSLLNTTVSWASPYFLTEAKIYQRDKNALTKVYKLSFIWSDKSKFSIASNSRKQICCNCSLRRWFSFQNDSSIVKMLFNKSPSK